MKHREKTEPKVTKVKAMHYVEDDGSKSFGYGFTGIIMELEDGRVFTENTAEPMRKWNRATTVSIPLTDDKPEEV